MSPDARILEQNLAALLRRAYVPALPRAELRRALLELARDEALRRRAHRGPRLLRRALPFAAAAAAALALWLALRPDAGDAAGRAGSAGELVARGAVALSFAGEPGWRAADPTELSAGLALLAGPPVEVHTPAALAFAVRAEDAQAALAPAGRAHFAPLPDPAFGAAGPGCGAELREGELTLALGPGAATWWLSTEAGLVRLAPDTALGARRAKGRTTVELQHGTAVLERPDGTELALAAGAPMALGTLVPADTGEGRGRQPVEPAELRALRSPDPQGEPAIEPPALVPPTGAALAGRVHDAEGKPVARFRVLLLREAEMPDVEEPILRDFEAEDGAFAWPDLKPDSYEVFVEADGFAQHRTGYLSFAEGAPRELDVTLAAGRTVRGWVLDQATETPLAGAEVVVETEVPSQILEFDLSDRPEWLRRVARAGADGGFVLDHVRPGAQRLRVAAAGHAPEWLELDVPAEGAEPEVLARLSPGGGIAGVVVDGAGQPRVGSLLLASFTGARIFSYKAAVTDEEGRYAFRDLPPAFHMVIRWDSEAQAQAGAPPELRPAMVARGKVTSIDFRADRSTLRLTGRFLDAAGAPRANQKFTILPAAANNLESSGDWQASNTDAQGGYTVELPGPATYLFFAVYGMGERLTLVDVLTVEPGTAELAHDVRYGATRVACTVLRADDRHPVAGALVVALRLDERGEDCFAANAPADAQGAVVLEGLLPGRYFITAGALDGQDLGQGASAVFELSAEEPQRATEILLPAGGVLRVRVTDAEGKPVEGARLELARAQGASIPTLIDPLLTARDGGCAVPALAPGTYTVTATREGFAPATASAEVRAALGGDLLLLLQPLD